MFNVETTKLAIVLVGAIGMLTKVPKRYESTLYAEHCISGVRCILTS